MTDWFNRKFLGFAATEREARHDPGRRWMGHPGAFSEQARYHERCLYEEERALEVSAQHRQPV